MSFFISLFNLKGQITCHQNILLFWPSLLNVCSFSTCIFNSY